MEMELLLREGNDKPASGPTVITKTNPIWHTGPQIGGQGKPGGNTGPGPSGPGGGIPGPGSNLGPGGGGQYGYNGGHNKVEILLQIRELMAVLMLIV